jgi:hypothetical protein
VNWIVVRVCDMDVQCLVRGVSSTSSQIALKKNSSAQVWHLPHGGSPAFRLVTHSSSGVGFVGVLGFFTLRFIS